MSYTRNRLPLLLVLAPAALLAGCGGGGGGGSTGGGGGGGSTGGGGGGGSQNYNGSVSGKVVDTSGNPVPTAVVLLDSNTPGANTPETTTINGGGYVINNVTPGLHTVFVSTTVNGTTDTGVTQVELANAANNNVTNANLIVAEVSPINQEATINGVVTDSTSGNAPVPNAEVFFQSAFLNPNTSGLGASAGTLNTASLVAYTNQNGQYTISLPVYQGTGTTPRAYAATAGYRTGDPASSFGNAALRSNLTYSAGATVNNVNFALALAQSATNTTPNISDVEAITQPLDPAFYTPGASPSAVAASGAESSSVYEQIHRLLSPQYAELIATGHPAARIKHLSPAAQPHTPDANQYGVEMDVFFALSGDTASAPAAVRQQLSGFQIATDAQTAPLDFLQDPLANVYNYQDIGSQALFFADTEYHFTVQSFLSDGSTAASAPSTAAAAAPLSFVNMVNPQDPIYYNSNTPLQNPIIGTLSDTNPVLQWSVYDSLTHIYNENITSYYVFLYSTFPGVTTTPIYSSGALNVGTTYNASTNVNSFTIPTTGTGSVTLTSGHEYWVVVAATATNNPSDSVALSLSQITPFTAQ